MKTTIARLICPRWGYYSELGDLARTLQELLRTAYPYRDNSGRWGSQGPTEILTAYHGCVNCQRHSWHSGRKGLSSYEQHWHGIRDVILNALCDDTGIVKQWRRENQITLEKEFRFPIKTQGCGAQQKAWEQFQALHGYRLQKSLNSSHRDTKVLCYPELEINPEGVYLTAKVSSINELHVSKECASRWDVGFLIRQENPHWTTNRETFDEFTLRAVTHFQNATPSDYWKKR